MLLAPVGNVVDGGGARGGGHWFGCFSHGACVRVAAAAVAAVNESNREDRKKEENKERAEPNKRPFGSFFPSSVLLIAVRPSDGGRM